MMAEECEPNALKCVCITGNERIVSIVLFVIYTVAVFVFVAKTRHIK